MDVSGTEASARKQSLSHWLVSQLDYSPELSPCGGDAGGRRYYALAEDAGKLAVDAPPQTENTRQFLNVANALSAGGVRVPEVYFADPGCGFLLVENLGQRLLGASITDGTAAVWYPRALDTLLQLAQLPSADAKLPYFDYAFIKRELAIFREWFVGEMLGVDIDAATGQMLDEFDEYLAQCVLSQPQVFMHRDYHSRNLLLNGDSVAVIDFQDAVVGPLVYDLVSLLKDCYLLLPPEQVRDWALAYKKKAEFAGLMTTVEPEEFLRVFDWVGLQRHIKVLGIFARLHLRDGKPGYLADLPRVLGYVLDVLERYPEFAGIRRWFEQALAPVYRQQEWYRDINPLDAERGAI